MGQKAAPSAGNSAFAAISLTLIVAFPVGFWLLLLELLVPALGLTYSLAARLGIGTVLTGLLFLVWTMVWKSGRDQ